MKRQNSQISSVGPILGTQYYRPPFPERKYWEDDMKRIVDSGLNTIQLWACWGWIEPEPGIFRFEDYDELILIAKDNGLKVIISTVAEIQPFWIMRVVPGSQMIDHMGNKVVSSLRCECNVGLTPGGCTDHPRLQELMANFLRKIVRHYAHAENLIGWDCWNEIRWAVQADGYVCYCPSTLKVFRDWLRQKYGDLTSLNRAWKRRYSKWDDVFPGKLPGRTYTEMMEFLRFLTWRTFQHMKFRCDTIRSEDSAHLISAHCGNPCTISSEGGYEQVLCRGNDWELASLLDSYGCSHFPFWFGFDETDFGMRIEAIRSATRNKILWISELQGGSIRDGHSVHMPVPAKSQQQWVWNSYARGAKAVIFWCWRDEVFGRESGGNGLNGDDGFADERLSAIRKTSELLHKYSSLLQNYKPDDPKVGILFEPDNYYIDWAQYGHSKHAALGVLGYARAFERSQIPYEIIESSHMEILKKLRLLFIPWPLVIKDNIINILIKFARNGGIILCESEVGAFNSLGFYYYPEDRAFLKKLGIKISGRRMIEREFIEVSLEKRKIRLKGDMWINHFSCKNSDILSVNTADNPIFIRKRIGQGCVYLLGISIGSRYENEQYRGFEDLVRYLVEESNAIPELNVNSESTTEKLQWRSGLSGSKRLLFVINSGSSQCISVRGPTSCFDSSNVYELNSGKKFKLSKVGNTILGFDSFIEEGAYSIYCWNVK